MMLLAHAEEAAEAEDGVHSVRIEDAVPGSGCDTVISST